MNEKIKWFGRYMNSKMTYKAVMNRSVYIVDVGSIFLSQILTDKYECKLILKELKYITEEDLCAVNKIISEYSEHLELHDEYTLTRSIEFLPDEIDFLRSKGYAIGIPKEYYITKEDLK